MKAFVGDKYRGKNMSRIVNIENILEEYNNYESFTGHPEYDEGFDTGIAYMVDELKELPVQIDYRKIAKKLWTYICIIDDEKETYEELANAIGLTDEELPLCRRLER